MDRAHTEVLSNARQMVTANNTVSLEDALVSDTGQLQYLRRLDSAYLRDISHIWRINSFQRTSANDDFLPRSDCVHLSVFGILNAACNQLIFVFLAVEQDTCNMSAGYDVQVASSLVGLEVCLL